MEKGHGRRETRRLRTTSILTQREKWAGMKQGFELERVRVVKGVRTVEVVYGVTSLSEEEADAKELLRLMRGHWRIENCLHYVRDVTMEEDKCRVRSGSAPQVLAALRNTALHLLAEINASSRAAAIRHLNARPEKALHLLQST